MKRRLIKQGGGGCTVYLPKKWLDSRSLKPGDDIEISELNESLIINSKSKTKSEFNLELKDPSKHEVYVKLSHLYIVGFDKINIIFNNPEIIKVISETVSTYLLGFEIISKEKNKCTIESITEPNEEKFNTLLRRIFLQIKDTYEQAKEDIINNKKENYQEIKNIRSFLDKHSFFCRRLISKRISLEDNLILHWELLTFLIQIQHCIFYLYEAYYNENLPKINETTKLILLSVEKYLDNYYKAYFEKRSECIDENLKNRFKVNEEIIKQLNDNKNKDKVILAFLKEIIRFIQIGGSPIRALIFDEHMKAKFL